MRRRIEPWAAVAVAAIAATAPSLGGAADPGTIVLAISGAPGTRFAGACVLGVGPTEETLHLDGQVPFTVELEVERLSCRIYADSALTVEARKAGNVTRTTTSGGTVNLRLE